MNNKQLAVVAVAVAVVLTVIIVLLVTGGPPPTEELAQDTAGDVAVSDGPAPPKEHSLADVRAARVYPDDDLIVFEVEMSVPIPQALRGESLAWRWEILEGGSETWIVSASVGVDDPVASVLSAQTGYGASTNDDTLPGELERDGNTLHVRLEHSKIEGFPDDFTWRLETSLDGDRGDATSAIASDTAPESGLGQYPPP